MKSFKIIDDILVCEECGLKTNRLTSLSLHIGHKYGQKQYFDRWLRDENDDKC